MADAQLVPEKMPVQAAMAVPDLWTQQQHQHQQHNMKSTVPNRPTFEGDGNRSIHDVFSDNYSVASWDDEEIALRQRMQTPLDEFPPASGSGHSGLHVARADYFAIAEGDGSHLAGESADPKIEGPDVESRLVQGSVQGFGALIALRKDHNGRLAVRVASDNTALILGYSPEELFAQTRFEDILAGDQTDTFLSYAELVTDGVYDLRAFGPEVFALSIDLTDGSFREVWCAISSSDGCLICEFESQNDRNFPLNVASRKTPPEKAAASAATATDRPSHRSANFRTCKSREGQGAASDVLTILSQVQEQLTRATSMTALLDRTAELVKELTDYDQILIFQLDPDWSATALAESMDEDVVAQRYKGFQFAGSFVSEQMRSVFVTNKVQLLYDRELRSAQLVYRSPEDMRRPLNLSHTYLQEMCPLQTQWLERMQVRSTMSISVNIADKLWGMIICHSYGDRGKRVSFLTRKICVLIGNSLGSNISRLMRQSRLPTRRLISAGPTATNPSSWYIAASSNGLLELFQADLGLISIRGETRSFGHQVPADGCLKLLEHLRDRHIDSVHSSLNIRQDYPDLARSHEFKNIAGFLFIPLSAGGADCIIFCRRSQPKLLRTVENPLDDRLGHYEVSAERAFRTSRAVVQNQSQPWSEADLETAAMLSLVYSRFIEIWRQKESTVHDVQAKRLLLANSAHELRTPLNAIINYLEIALEGSLAADVRNYLLESHSLSKSLIYHINDLLDLTKTKGELESMRRAQIDLYATIKDACSAFTNDAKLKGITYEIQMAADLPRYPRGNQRHIRQAVTNLLSNAFKFTRSGSVLLKCTARLISPSLAEVRISVHDTGVGMSPAHLDALKQCIDHVALDDDAGPSNFVTNGRVSRCGRDHDPCTLGLGLALVVRILHCYHGTLTVESNERKGSRFQMLFQFSLDAESPPLPSTGITTPTDDTDSNLIGTKAELASPLAANGGASHMLAGNNDNIGRQEETKCDSPITQARGVAPSEWRPATPHAKKQPSSADVLTNFQSPCSLQSTRHSHSLNILVAEDDPINRKILQKRLEKVGHRLLITNDGNECLLAYLAQPDAFDVILMDIQMPILDGLKATELIRANRTRKSRVPIFAVSASLLETKMDEYISVGFDGWVLKPVDLNNITRLLQGVYDAAARARATYTPGVWLRGGWFARQ